MKTIKKEIIQENSSLKHLCDMENEINALITASKVDTSKISDGYHTFGELYKHRINLFIALALAIKVSDDHSLSGEVWKSEYHSDGSHYDGWFVMGIGIESGKQITYHLPYEYWDSTEFATLLENAPTYDGHTSDDVLQRLLKL